jgi:hypothetical protein
MKAIACQLILCARIINKEKDKLGTLLQVRQLPLPSTFITVDYYSIIPTFDITKSEPLTESLKNHK